MKNEKPATIGQTTRSLKISSSTRAKINNFVMMNWIFGASAPLVHIGCYDELQAPILACRHIETKRAWFISIGVTNNRYSVMPITGEAISYDIPTRFYFKISITFLAITIHCEFNSMSHWNSIENCFACPKTESVLLNCIL